MSDSLEGMRRKIGGVDELKSVVRTMKTLAAAAIGQCERAAQASADYHRSIELALAACVNDPSLPQEPRLGKQAAGPIGVIVFGSDQGLVGQFNEHLAEHVGAALKTFGGPAALWIVGEKMEECLLELKFPAGEIHPVPNSVAAIPSLVGRLLAEFEERRERTALSQLYVFHHRPVAQSAYEPVTQRLLPFDAQWEADLKRAKWPAGRRPEMIGSAPRLFPSLVREYLFVALARACAESLASENASRLAAMQRAEKNIDELRENLNRSFRSLRQSSIDEELFDVVSGFEALQSSVRPGLHQAASR